MDVKLIRVNRTLHDHFPKAPCGSDKHHLVKAGFGINGEHHARRCEVGAHHPLNTGRERHATVIVTLVHTIRDGAIVKQRSKYMLHCHENGVKTLNVEEGFLLTGKEASGISSAVAEERTAKEAFSSSAESCA